MAKKAPTKSTAPAAVAKTVAEPVETPPPDIHAQPAKVVGKEPPPSSPQQMTAAELAAEYDHGDTEWNPELDQFPAPAAAEAAETTEPEPAAPATEATAEAETPSNQHDPVTVSLARQLGISDEMIGQMSPAELGRTTALMAQNAIRSRTQEAPRPVEPQAPQKSPLDIAIEAMKNDGASDAIVEAFKALNGQLAEKDRQNAALLQQFQAQQAESVNDRLDRLFTTRADVLGTQKRAALTESSPEMARRMAVLAEMNRLEQLDQRTGTRRNMEDYFAAASGNLFPVATPATPATPAAPATPESNGHSRITKEQWAAAGSAKPTNRYTELPKGDRRAELRVAEMLRQSGAVIEDDTDGGEESGIPG